MTDERDDGDDNVTDIDEARRRREADDVMRELRDPPSIGTVVRRQHGLRPLCMHRETVVDSMARVVQCRACGVELDPYDVIDVTAREHEFFAQVRAERKRIQAEIETLRAEEKRIKARLKTARAKRPVVDGEIALLRRLEEAVRKHSWLGKAERAALDALDALRNGAPA